MTRRKLTIAAPTPSRSSGSIRGLGGIVAADEFSGAFSMSIPLPLPSARGSRPALDLRYCSSTGNGPFGIGFAVSAGSVARSTARSAPKYRIDDVFTHSDYGELVYLAGADRQGRRDGHSYSVRSYRPRHDGEFPSIEWWTSPGGSFWLVVDRDNMTSVYGPDPASRVTDASPAHPAGPERVFEWLLAETFDARGSHVLYEYLAEDGAGLPATASRAARYLSTVRWGNMTPRAESLALAGPAAKQAGPAAQQADPGWHYQAVFDYGQGQADGQPARAWPVRPDPFTSYRAGFAVGTYRLCRSIETLHHFPAELGPAPVPVGCLRLRYELSPYGSLLASVEQTGYRTDQHGRRRARALAPAELTWSGFDHRDAEWVELDFGPQARPDLAPDDDLRWVDLDGTGVAGLLHCGADGIRFWAPRQIDPAGGVIRYDAPRLIRSAPTGAAADASAFTLADALGTGRLQWLDPTPGSARYAELKPDGSAGPSRTFDGIPSDYGSPATAMVNVTGTGLPDLVLIGATDVQWHACLGPAGYGPRQRVPGGSLPPGGGDEPGEARRYADVLGSGEQHRVRVRNGSVTCWPNLGYGRFGPPVELAGAPYLEPGFDPDRLYLLDLDGSGAADLGYRYPHAVRIWRNQSGNGFAPPFDIPLPPGADASARIDFADVLGTGTSCLVVSQPFPTPRHWAYVFGHGAKPYLLTGIDSGTGQVTGISYTTSAQQQIADPPSSAGLPTAPFPVHVVSELRHDDLLSATSNVQTFRYRHGCYDPAERTFNGFGFVGRQDAQPTADGSGPPPLLTRTWYHTGAEPAAGSLESLYRPEYFAGDPRRYRLAESSRTAGPGAEATRQALVSLAGRPLHQELYGLDGSAWQALPYLVDEFRYLTSQLLPDADSGPVPFHCRLLESVSYDYERNPADPRVRHVLLLAADDFGNMTDECEISYPRRSAPDVPAQAELICYRSRHGYLNVTDGYRLVGVPAEDLDEQVTGLLPGTDGYLTPETLAGQLAGRGVTSTVTQWARYRYHPGTAGTLVGPQRLLVSASYAEHDRAALERVCARALPPAELTALLGGTGPAGCGLVPGDSAGGGAGGRAGAIAGAPDAAQWWWNPGHELTYAGAAGFFRPRASRDPFGHTATAADDPYCLFITEVTDPLGNRTIAVPDYQALEYGRITDPNGSVTEFGFDPLGLPEATSRHGTEGGTSVGFAPLAEWQIPAEPPPLAALTADPGGYLQRAATAFAYDPLAWTGAVTAAALQPLGADPADLWADLVDRGYLSSGGAVCQRFRDDFRCGRFALSARFEPVLGRAGELLAAVPGRDPVAGLLLTATGYPAGGGQIVTQLIYYDGFQRALQAKHSTGDPAQPWLASGTVRYDAKGQLRQQFEPYYSASARYDPAESADKLGVSSILHYDALGRLVRTDTPLGTYRATVYGWDREAEGSPWTVTVFDENDTLVWSEYFSKLMSALAPDPAEKEVAEQAALCADSPVRSCLDPAKRVVRAIRQDAAVVTAERLAPFGDQASRLLTALTSAGYLDGDGRFTTAFRGYLPGWTVTLPPPFDAQADRITELLAGLWRRGTQLPTDLVLDALGKPARVSDARLGPAGLANFQSDWSLAGDNVRTLSSDAGPRWTLRNAEGNVVWERDGIGTVTVSGYDELQRVTSKRATRADAGSNTCLVAVYGDSRDGAGQPYFADPGRWNLRGHLVLSLDTAGLSLEPFRTTLGAPFAHRRILAPDPATEPDWSRLPSAELTALAAALERLRGPEELSDLELPPGLQPLLETTGYTERAGYDAVGRELLTIDADGNRLDRVLDHRGRVAGALLTPAGHDPVPPGQAAYDAHDRPVALTVPGVLRSSYRYSPATFQLTGIRAVAWSGAVLQDLTYYHDAVGNVGLVRNAAAAGGLPAPAEPARYRYDLLYRLVAATGREAADGAAPVPYRVEYGHDASGNLVWADHQGATSRRREFAVAPDSNRLVAGAGYDGNGNVVRSPQAASVSWTHHHQIASVTTPPAADGSVTYEFSSYAGDGARLRRVFQRKREPGAPGPAAVEDVRTIGMLEIVRQTDSAGREREWHATTVTAGPLQLGRWIRWTADSTGRLPAAAMRYPLTDVIGSMGCEVDATGRPLTYREYLPFGGDALSWSATAMDDELQRSRYGGKELGAAGLYYYGARHYSPELMRWMSPDPAGTADTLNLYQFVGGNPVTFADSDGRVKVMHWNIYNLTRDKAANKALLSELGSLLTAAAHQDSGTGTVLFLTEVMHSMDTASFDAMMATLNAKSPGWTGKLLFAGYSEGRGRLEKIAILTYNIHVESYWQLVRNDPVSRQYFLEHQQPGTAFQEKHHALSRFPVGVRVTTQLGGGTTGLNIGGYHNQGPGKGAETRAGEVIDAAITAGVHFLIGDWNVRPPPRRRQPRTGMQTRRSPLTDAVTRGSAPTTRGGHQFDFGQVLNQDIGSGRDLTAREGGLKRARDSDHHPQEAELRSAKRQRRD